MLCFANRQSQLPILDLVETDPFGSASLFSYSPALQPRAQKVRLRAQSQKNQDKCAQKVRLRAQSHKNQDKCAQKQRLCAQNWEIYVKQARKL